MKGGNARDNRWAMAIVVCKDDYGPVSRRPQKALLDEHARRSISDYRWDRYSGSPLNNLWAFNHNWTNSVWSPSTSLDWWANAIIRPLVCARSRVPLAIKTLSGRFQPVNETSVGYMRRHWWDLRPFSLVTRQIRRAHALAIAIGGPREWPINVHPSK